MLADAVDRRARQRRAGTEGLDGAPLPTRARDRGTPGRHAAVSGVDSGGCRARTQLHRARPRRSCPPLPAVYPARRSLHAARSASRRRWRAVPFDRKKSCSSGDAIRVRDRAIPLVPVKVTDLTDPAKIHDQQTMLINYRAPALVNGKRPYPSYDAAMLLKSQSQIEVGEKPEISSGCLQGQSRLRRHHLLGPASTCFRLRSAPAR